MCVLRSLIQIYFKMYLRYFFCLLLVLIFIFAQTIRYRIRNEERKMLIVWSFDFNFLVLEGNFHGNSDWKVVERVGRGVWSAVGNWNAMTVCKSNNKKAEENKQKYLQLTNTNVSTRYVPCLCVIKEGETFCFFFQFCLLFCFGLRIFIAKKLF